MKTYYKQIAWVSFAVALFVPSASIAFDVVDREKNYADSKYVSLSAGAGMTGFAHQKGVSGDAGFGFQIKAGHAFSRYLQAEFLYQFSTFDWTTPDPIDPSRNVHTGASLNQIIMRALLLYPEFIVQPYVTVGVGGYSFMGVNQETAMSFPMHMLLPVGAGARSYIYKNQISFDVEYNYQIFFGENQSADTLALLGLNKVSFNMYSIMGTFTFHLF